VERKGALIGGIRAGICLSLWKKKREKKLSTCKWKETATSDSCSRRERGKREKTRAGPTERALRDNTPDHQKKSVGDRGELKPSGVGFQLAREEGKPRGRPASRRGNFDPGKGKKKKSPLTPGPPPQERGGKKGKGARGKEEKISKVICPKARTLL